MKTTEFKTVSASVSDHADHHAVSSRRRSELFAK